MTGSGEGLTWKSGNSKGKGFDPEVRKVLQRLGWGRVDLEVRKLLQESGQTDLEI